MAEIIHTPDPHPAPASRNQTGEVVYSEVRSSAKGLALFGFLLLFALLWFFGDVLTAVIGTALIGAAFMTYYSPRKF